MVGGCASTPAWVSDPSDPNNIIIEKQIRFYAERTGIAEADLTKVTRLNLGRKQLTSAKGLEKLTQLTHLQLNDNQLTELPKGLEKLTQLKYLNLSDNKLTDVKGLENLTQLKTLYLNFNKLTDVPKGLEKLTKLTKLDLADNSALTKTQIDALKKALPKCLIISNPTK